jgi:transketolase
MGAYVVLPAQQGPEVGAIVSTGSEVYLCIEAAQELAKQGVFVRVVSMPCSRLFDEQAREYKKLVFPQGLFVVSVEAASVEGWPKYSHLQVGLRTFGKSAPYLQVYKHFGMDGPGIAATVAKAAAFYKARPVPWLMDVMDIA